MNPVHSRRFLPRPPESEERQAALMGLAYAGYQPSSTQPQYLFTDRNPDSPIYGSTIAVPVAGFTILALCRAWGSTKLELLAGTVAI